MKTHAISPLYEKVIVIFFMLAALLLFAKVASAHESTTVGDYTVEYGWLSEPAVVGQPNAVVINLSTANSTSPEIDISKFQITVVLGSDSKELTLQPLGENTPGQYIAPITPTRPGIYTIHLGGAIAAVTFDTDVQPEEVQTADVVQFPAIDPAQATATTGGLGLPGWLGIAGIVLGAFGTGFGLLTFSRKGK